MVVARSYTSTHSTVIRFNEGQAPDMEDIGRPFRPSWVRVYLETSAMIGEQSTTRLHVSVHGRRILKSGEMGKQELSAYYNVEGGEEPPAWVEELIESTTASIK